jgi:hypothetical protein
MCRGKSMESSGRKPCRCRPREEHLRAKRSLNLFFKFINFLRNFPQIEAQFVPCGMCIIPTVIPAIRSQGPSSLMLYFGTQSRTGKVCFTHFDSVKSSRLRSLKVLRAASRGKQFMLNSFTLILYERTWSIITSYGGPAE